MADEEYIMWDSFSNHVMDMMKQLIAQHDFADVTLISEDKITFKAHKNILSASSPFFKDILQVDSSRTPFIFLKGITGIALQSILNFIYLGNATIHHDRIKDLILSANILEIKGLGDFELENKDQQNPPKTHSQLVEDKDTPFIISEVTKKESLRKEEEVYTETLMKDELFIIPEEKVKHTDDETHTKGKLDDSVDNVIVGMDFDFSEPENRNDNSQALIQSQSTGAINRQGQRESGNEENGNIEKEINQKFGKEFHCKKCDKVLKSEKMFNQHMRVHKDYSCHLCNHKALTQQAYDKHMSHEHNLNFNCFMCDFKAEEHQHLREHYESIHEGRKENKCTKCNYIGKTSADLIHHKNDMHKITRVFNCVKCPYQTFYKTTLRKHLMGKHILPKSEVNEIISKCEMKFDEKIL